MSGSGSRAASVPSPVLSASHALCCEHHHYPPVGVEDAEAGRQEPEGHRGHVDAEPCHVRTGSLSLEEKWCQGGP